MLSVLLEASALMRMRALVQVLRCWTTRVTPSTSVVPTWKSSAPDEKNEPRRRLSGLWCFSAETKRCCGPHREYPARVGIAGRLKKFTKRRDPRVISSGFLEFPQMWVCVSGRAGVSTRSVSQAFFKNCDLDRFVPLEVKSEGVFRHGFGLLAQDRGSSRGRFMAPSPAF